jgi:hypothetical protein
MHSPAPPRLGLSPVCVASPASQRDAAAPGWNDVPPTGMQAMKVAGEAVVEGNEARGMTVTHLVLAPCPGQAEWRSAAKQTYPGARPGLRCPCQD